VRGRSGQSLLERDEPEAMVNACMEVSDQRLVAALE
jgi:hypothetical protein